MQARYPLRDGESEPGATDIRGSAAASDVTSIEALEDVRLREGRNASTTISDGDVIMVSSPMKRHGDRAPGWSMPNGIVDKIDNHPSDQLFVTGERRAFRFVGDDFDRDILPFR